MTAHPRLDPVGLDPDELAALLHEVRDSAARLGAALDGLTDDQARGPSALDGWSRGHVITHLARSADVYRWLLALARTGTEPGPRADGATLDRALREGAGRGAAELAADLRESLRLLLAEAAAMPADRWPVLLTALAGWRHPAWFVLQRARREFETHHADLELGYGSADWPSSYVGWALDQTAATLAAAAVPVRRIEATDLGRGWSPAATGPTVSGPGHALLAWLAGRADGTALRSDAPLPAVPRWPAAPAPGWG
ncbi:maleylpyruvate isomerase family mycothiol-dependent enzyme [Kitasatospora sp. NPDC006697]|uniref:maleylpyruvate isomerase family mycothiol-dependent enzyme n=1 Tax=Kitasatospora sp. NPDC006697 TaxID=3364020 RepID=UPI00368A664A